MAEVIVVRVRPDLQKAKQQASELQRKQQQIERQRREGRREEARAARRPVTTAPRRKPDQPRRGRLAAGVVRAGGQVRGIGRVAIAAALAAVGIEISTKFLLPLGELGTEEALEQFKDVPILKQFLEKQLEFQVEIRQGLEKLKVFVVSGLAAAAQTRESLNGAALLGAQIADVDVGGTFQARRSVNYLREASRAVVQSDLGADALKKLVKSMAETLKKNVAGKK